MGNHKANEKYFTTRRVSNFLRDSREEISVKLSKFEIIKMNVVMTDWKFSSFRNEVEI